MEGRREEMKERERERDGRGKNKPGKNGEASQTWFVMILTPGKYEMIFDQSEYNIFPQENLLLFLKNHQWEKFLILI